MKRRPATLLLAVLLLAPGCDLLILRSLVNEHDEVVRLNEHGPRVAAYLSEHPETRHNVRDLLWHRRICLGMNREQVWAAWGRPANTSTEGHWVYDHAHVFFDSRGLVSGWD